MSFEEFRTSLAAPAPPAGLSRPLLALWYDAHDDWEKAHQAAQEETSRQGSWVHAYLHRKEGDIGNAAYWYATAGQKAPSESVTLQAEWEAIARALLGG
jgi:hypothetical protein